MLTKRIIACLDVKDNKVVKGIKFKNHVIVGDILDLSKRYRDEGVDELVFYDISASSDGRVVSKNWVKKVAHLLDIPFCVAGGIRTVEDAKEILYEGADKISINSPALERPSIIKELSDTFGVQCIVVGIDSMEEANKYKVYQYTGDEKKIIKSKYNTVEWVKKVAEMGAGEIVLNCMDNDGVRMGYNIKQINEIKKYINIPLIASGGAGVKEDFFEVFSQTKVDGALAASVFHNNKLKILDLKKYLYKKKIKIRL